MNVNIMNHSNGPVGSIEAYNGLVCEYGTVIKCNQKSVIIQPGEGESFKADSLSVYWHDLHSVQRDKFKDSEALSHADFALVELLKADNDSIRAILCFASSRVVSRQKTLGGDDDWHDGYGMISNEALAKTILTLTGEC